MRYALSLRASHPDRPASAIVEAVGLSADVHATAGEARQFPRTGKVGALSRRTYAVFSLGKGDAADLPLCMTRAAEHLEARRDQLAGLRAAGVAFEFFVGLFLEGNEGIEIAPALLRRLAGLEISLSLDIYPPDGGRSEGFTPCWTAPHR